MSDESHLPAGQPATGVTDRGPGYEVRDTRVSAIVTFLVGLFLFIIVAQVFLWGLLRSISSDKPEPGAIAAPELILTEQLRQLRKGEDAALGLDTEHKPGPGKLSINDAIDLLAERGIAPVAPRTAAEVNSHSGMPAMTPQESTDKDKAKKDQGQDKSGRGGD
jgi:hypothetical protein